MISIYAHTAFRPNAANRSSDHLRMSHCRYHGLDARCWWVRFQPCSHRNYDWQRPGSLNRTWTSIGGDLWSGSAKQKRQRGFLWPVVWIGSQIRVHLIKVIEVPTIEGSLPFTLVAEHSARTTENFSEIFFQPKRIQGGSRCQKCQMVRADGPTPQLVHSLPHWSRRSIHQRTVCRFINRK